MAIGLLVRPMPWPSAVEMSYRSFSQSSGSMTFLDNRTWKLLYLSTNLKCYSEAHFLPPAREREGKKFISRYLIISQQQKTWGDDSIMVDKFLSPSHSFSLLSLALSLSSLSLFFLSLYLSLFSLSLFLSPTLSFSLSPSRL
jgi:hypothetical protein